MSHAKPALTLIALAAALDWASAAAAQAVPGAASGEAALEPSVSFNLGAASDGLFRGVSRTSDRAQASGSIEASLSELYVGAWASNAAFRGPDPARSGAEVDLYGGWRPELFGYSLDIGAQYDAFAGQPNGLALNYVELYAKALRTLGPVTGRIGVHYSPDFAAHGGRAWYAEAGADYALDRDWSFSAQIGRQTGERATLVGGGDYLTWSGGVTRSLGQRLSIALRYSDTDHHVYGQAWDNRLVGEIWASF